MGGEVAMPLPSHVLMAGGGEVFFAREPPGLHPVRPSALMLVSGKWNS
jgi:hypothetical protein